MLPDVKDQINEQLKRALEEKTREAEGSRAFLVEAETLLRHLTPNVASQTPSE